MDDQVHRLKFHHWVSSHHCLVGPFFSRAVVQHSRCVLCPERTYLWTKCSLCSSGPMNIPILTHLLQSIWCHWVDDTILKEDQGIQFSSNCVLEQVKRVNIAVKQDWSAYCSPAHVHVNCFWAFYLIRMKGTHFPSGRLQHVPESILICSSIDIIKGAAVTTGVVIWLSNGISLSFWRIVWCFRSLLVMKGMDNIFLLPPWGAELYWTYHLGQASHMASPMVTNLTTHALKPM